MKIRVLLLTLVALCLALQSKAIVTNWTGLATGGGTNANNWYNASNWSNGVPGISDDAQIGVSVTYVNSPVINASTTVKSLTFGVRSSGSLTINSGVILTVTNDVTATYASASATINILGQTVSGVLGGTLTCGGSFRVGDTTAPITPAQNGTINTTYVVTVGVTIQQLNVAGSLILNTTSSSATVTNVGYSSNVNNPVFWLNNGSLNVSQNLQITNSAYVNTALSGYTTAGNTGRLITNPIDNAIVGSTSTLAFGGAISIATAGFVDFNGAGVGSSSIIYNGTTAQTVYTNATTGLGVSPANYQNLTLSGTGVKTIQAGTVTISGNWNSSGGNIDAVTNAPAIYFQGAAQSLTDAGSNGGIGMVFETLYIQGTSTKTLTSGKFSIANTGVLTMAGTATLAAGGNLTLLSDATSSATVAPLPAGTAITGNVNVQRFIKGSPTDLSKRGYRFISSAVYTAAPGGVKAFDLKYLLDDAYVSGASGGGFNAPVTINPSLYLYREDIAPSNTFFTSGNFKGIAKINNTNLYDIGIQKRLTITNVADTTINLPVGNGVMFFFRGNKLNNATQSGSKVAAPFDYPENVAFTQTGQLNTGTIDVRPWHKFDNSAPGTNLPYSNYASLNNSTVRGFVLIGNPYASTINWEKFNRNGANSSIYGGGFPAASVTQSKIWIYNPTSKQYDTYLQAPSISAVTDTTTTINPSGSIHTGDASNMIASGQGFFIRTTATGQTLSFRESAKTNMQPVAANLIRLMSAPVSPSALALSSSIKSVQAPTGANPMLSFKLLKDNINTDDVVLAFNNHSENNFSATDDAEDLNGYGALVSLSIISADEIAASIKQIKLPQNNRQVIKLMADATASGQYQLKFEPLESLPAVYNIWLKDDFTNDSLDLKSNDTYIFNIDKNTAATYGRNRFKILISRNQALSMRLRNFNAEKTTMGARLLWQTDNEEPGYVFEIQRSTDNGKTYQVLDQINSNGLGAYSYLDTKPGPGVNLYKIKMINTELETEDYTAIATLNYGEAVEAPIVISKVMVYPNPATDKINIRMVTTNANSDSYQVQISNSIGLVIRDVVTSQANLEQDVTGLIAGTYVVRVLNITENKVHGESKFIKLN